MFARAKLVHDPCQAVSAPEGARIAIFVSSGNLHPVQGCTADERELLASMDPDGRRAHVPMMHLMGENLGEGDQGGDDRSFEGHGAVFKLIWTWRQLRIGWRTPT